MRLLGVPVYTPRDAAADLVAFDGFIRTVPRQIDRALAIGEQLVDIGQRILEIAERLDHRADSIHRLGEQLDRKATDLLSLGGEMRHIGSQIDERGAEIVDRAGQVVMAAADLANVLPTIERALELATPLEGAIDRFGRLVDRFPGGPGSARRREDAG